MGTSVEVRAVGGDAATRAEAIQEAFAAIAEVDRVMSNWRADSEITAANRDAADFAVRLSDPLFSVIQAGQTVADRSGGAFDMTVGPLIRLWGFRPRNPQMPTSPNWTWCGARELPEHPARPGRPTVRFVRPGVEIDLGGIAKGFAVELAAGVFDTWPRRFHRRRRQPVHAGAPDRQATWIVGVRDPDRVDGLLGTLELPPGSVSTSAHVRESSRGWPEVRPHLRPAHDHAERRRAGRHAVLARAPWPTPCPRPCSTSGPTAASPSSTRTPRCSASWPTARRTARVRSR